MTNITVGRIFGVLITIGTFWYSWEIISKVISGTYPSTMLVFVIFLVIIGFIGIGIAVNFNNILTLQKQSQKTTKPASPMTRIGGVALLLMGGLNLVMKLSELIQPNPSFGEILVNLALPIALIAMGVGLLRRK